ncbi:hypothetical protein B0H10DRAFT_1971365 [Mycena sp. CBHHK59/15]|nr:hypothetical protein B0H10DRAFT_1971365 [Mycena sp. CBHHK59/15]
MSTPCKSCTAFDARKLLLRYSHDASPLCSLDHNIIAENCLPYGLDPKDALKARQVGPWRSDGWDHETRSQAGQKASRFKEVFTPQDDDALKKVYRQANVQFPELRRYTSNWPVKCILQAHLKVTKTVSKTAIVSHLSRAVGGKTTPRKTIRVCLNSSGIVEL